jgi:hypothetical protein
MQKFHNPDLIQKIREISVIGNPPKQSGSVTGQDTTAENV